MISVASSNSLLDDEGVSEKLIGRLHHATEDGVRDLVAALRPKERAKLAMFCYLKSHLHQVGLTIASTCDLNSLVREWGAVRGRAIFAQSRKPPDDELGRTGVRPRPKITLARSAGGNWPPLLDIDDVPQPVVAENFPASHPDPAPVSQTVMLAPTPFRSARGDAEVITLAEVREKLGFGLPALTV